MELIIRLIINFNLSDLQILRCKTVDIKKRDWCKTCLNKQWNINQSVKNNIKCIVSVLRVCKCINKTYRFAHLLQFESVSWDTYRCHDDGWWKVISSPIPTWMNQSPRELCLTVYTNFVIFFFFVDIIDSWISHMKTHYILLITYSMWIALQINSNQSCETT